MKNHNLFAVLRAEFPADLDQVAVETADGSAPVLRYCWRDLERASAMLANLLDALALDPASRVAVRVGKSVEATMLYWATLRAGHVFLPLGLADQSADTHCVMEDAKPAVVVCEPGHFGWVSKMAFNAGARYVFTLGDDRSGSLLQRAAHHSDRHTPAMKGDDDLAAMVYTSDVTGRHHAGLLTHGDLCRQSAAARVSHPDFGGNGVAWWPMPGRGR